MEFQVREATTEDASEIGLLLNQLGYPQEIEAIKKGISACNNISHYKIILALDNLKLAGLITFYIIEQFFVQTKKCHIEGLVISNEYRRKGIGKLLIEEAEKYAIKQKCRLVDLFSNKRRAIEGTHDFYASLGYGNDGEKAVKYFKKYLV